MKRELTIHTGEPADLTGVLATFIPKENCGNMWELWIRNKYVFDIIKEEDGTLYIHYNMGICTVTVPQDDFYVRYKEIHNTTPVQHSFTPASDCRNTDKDSPRKGTGLTVLRGKQ